MLGRIKEVDRSTAALRAVEALREAILAGELRAGELLRQDELAERLGISRMPLREALRQLESEGFVSSSPHRSVVVASLSIEELREISEIRAALECHLFRLAIPAHTKASIKRVQDAIDKTDSDERALEHWGAANWRFHSELYTPANRPRTLAQVEMHHAHTERYLRIHVSFLKHFKKGQKEHRALLDAVRAGDIDGGAAMLREHIMIVPSVIGEVLR